MRLWAPALEPDLSSTKLAFMFAARAGRVRSGACPPSPQSPPVSQPSPGAPIEPPPPQTAAQRKAAWWRGRWVTIGEIVGVGALGVALLGYLDARRERAETRVERTRETRVEAARAALVLTATADADGARLTLSPMRPGQAVQSQRYLFPKAVLDHAMEVAAAQPQIDRGWIAAGLVRAAKAGGGAPTGEGALPVGLETTYVEDGETRIDRSLYRLGYRVEKGGLFAGPRVVLQGLSLERRGVSGDLQAAVETRWRTVGARGSPPSPDARRAGLSAGRRRHPVAHVLHHADRRQEVVQRRPGVEARRDDDPLTRGTRQRRVAGGGNRGRRSLGRGSAGAGLREAGGRSRVQRALQGREEARARPDGPGSRSPGGRSPSR